MITRHDTTGSIDALEQLLDDMEHNAAVTGILILACDSNGFTPATIDPILQRIRRPIFGGIFPGILYDKQKYDKGTIVVGFQQTTRISVIHGLNDDDTCYTSQLGADFTAAQNNNTILVFVDVYSLHTGDFLSELEKLYPESGDYIGGGAGSAKPMLNGAEVTPSIFTNQGLLEGCAVVAHIDVQCAIGIGHGFEPVEGPFRVSCGKAHEILALDGQPALQAYHNMVSLYSGHQVQFDELMDLSKAYPLGLLSPENGFVVRDILAMHDDALVTVTRIQDGEFVYLVTGNKDTLIGAAIEARKEALAKFGNAPRKLTLLVGCISRVIFLGDDLSRELAAIWPEDHPAIGFLSLGEIARYHRNHVGLFNKTCVVGILGE